MSVFNSKTFFESAAKSDIIKIIVTISLFYVILHFIRISILIGGDDVSFFFNQVWNKLSLPADIKLFLKQPWSIISFMFCDMSIMQIIGNMIWLWVFGTVIEDLLGRYKVIPIFITGGILGAAFLLLSNSYLPTQGLLYAGSIPSVAAVATAAIIYKPKYQFWILDRYNIPIWVFGVVFFLLQYFAMGGLSIAMLSLLFGGILAGVAFNYGLVTYYEAFSNRLKKMDSFFWNNKNFVVKDKRAAHRNTIIGESYKVISINEKKLDFLLDKINEKGMDSLSHDEKKQLEDFSKQTN